LRPRGKKTFHAGGRWADRETFMNLGGIRRRCIEEAAGEWCAGGLTESGVPVRAVEWVERDIKNWAKMIEGEVRRDDISYLPRIDLPLRSPLPLLSSPTAAG
jgi:hypothetical protein